jgi:hypothetical protein
LVPGSVYRGGEQDQEEDSDKAREGATMFAQHDGRLVTLTVTGPRFAIGKVELRVSEKASGSDCPRYDGR